MLKLDLELFKIRGIAEKFLKRLDKLGIKNVKDLIWHFPFRYEDYTKLVKIADLKVNQPVTVRGTIKKVALRRTWRRRMILVEALVVDETGGISAIWFNQPYIAQTLKVGKEVNFSGKAISSQGRIYLSSPSYEFVSNLAAAKHTAGLIPVYPETKSLTSRGLRYLIEPILKNLEKIDDFLPKEVLEKYELPEINLALKRIHFPRILNQANLAKKRFAFEDLFLLQLNNLRIKSNLMKEKAVALKIDLVVLEKILKNLPFELTISQKRSLDEILSDLSKFQPMNRLLQGDVGSGKTVVAAVAAAVSAINGKQAVFMAPTEVLARQHYKTLTAIFSAAGKDLDFSIGLLTGGEVRSFYGEGLEEKKTKNQLLKEITGGAIKIIIGTHAVIQKSVAFQDLALAIIDEQHRFGVEQRAALLKNQESRISNWGNGVSDLAIYNSKFLIPHFLSMGATPIPRTLSLTLFGDLDLSIIDELPVGRKPIVTKIVAPVSRTRAYNFIREQIKSGRQVFVICPRIQSADSADETQNNAESIENSQRISVASQRQSALWDVKNVTEEYEKLSKQIFPDLRVGMLHGKMRTAEKSSTMADFAAGMLDILISTSVVEVGVDVPNATIMMIEGADRFGLAQLYQFRGRVGRGEHQSYCFLFTDSTSESTQQRLAALIKAKNGFELAEIDLQLRGPGQFLGDKQTGLPDLAMRSLNNFQLVREARAAASEILEKDKELTNYPLLAAQLGKFEKTIHLE